MKGNINFTNEIIDNVTSRDELKSNETLIDLLKALKDMEPKLFKVIQQVSNEDVMAICLMVNEDLQKTFGRYKAIKNGEVPKKFVPGEVEQASTIHYLKPTHVYGSTKARNSPQKLSSPMKSNDDPARGGGNGEIDLLTGFSSSEPSGPSST